MAQPNIVDLKKPARQTNAEALRDLVYDVLTG
jgi:hypothetical protein